MKILLLNGSPRLSGNTKTALNEISRGISSNIPGAEIELVDITKYKVSGCVNCDSCMKNGGSCVQRDDTNEIIQKVYDADAVILGTPVYYWGVSAQMKTVVDKFYSKDEQFRQQKKKLGIVAVGAGSLDDPEYALITAQFECICNYLGWDIIFSHSVSAANKGDLAGDSAKLKDLSGLWQKI
jgi:multimeric flavodoxin WrbA